MGTFITFWCSIFGYRWWIKVFFPLQVNNINDLKLKRYCFLLNHLYFCFLVVVSYTSPNLLFGYFSICVDDFPNILTPSFFTILIYWQLLWLFISPETGEDLSSEIPLWTMTIHVTHCYFYKASSVLLNDLLFSYFPPL